MKQKKFLCEYGCGEISKYKFKNGSYCCSLYLQSCKNIKSKNSNKNKISQSGSNNAMFGKKQTEESKQKNRLSNIKNWTDENSIYHTEKFRNKLIESNNIKPNKLEIYLKDILNEICNNRFEYVGDFKKFIGRKNPDFIDKDNKLIIELFGDYWHGKEYRKKYYNDLTTNEEHEKERIEYFKKYNYSSLIIWNMNLIM